MHMGDICNLGIFCVDLTSNWNLLDFISETVDPTTGYAHIAYADDNTATGCESRTRPAARVSFDPDRRCACARPHRQRAAPPGLTHPRATDPGACSFGA
jgi:hypothetical protein